MNMRLLIGLTSFSFAWPVWAQTQPPTTQPQAPIQAQPQARERTGIGLTPIAQRLAGRLELTPEQQAQYDKIVAKHEALARQQRGQRDEMRTLSEQYREARQSGDDQKAEEIRKQMQELRAGRDQIFKAFFDEVATILTPAQKDNLDRFRERFAQIGPDARGGDEVQAILRAARRLELKDEQKNRMRDILHEAQAEHRKVADDPQASAELAKRLKTQITEMLDAKQAAEFEQLLTQASQPGRRGPRGPESRPAAPGPGRLQRQGNP